MSDDPDRLSPARVLKIQSVLYENDAAALDRFVAALAVCQVPAGYRLLLHLGDCSQHALVSPKRLAEWQRVFRGEQPDAGLRYSFFGENLGFSRGHNRLWRELSGADRLLVLNADAVPAFHLLTRLSRLADRQPGFGAVDARQIPIEHAKRFDPATLETDWVSGACCLLDGAAFDAVGGYDELFFLYGEDVDLSWRLRAAGHRLYFCPETFLYHAKRLVDGQVGASDAERYHGALSSLLLRAKYGREDLNARPLRILRENPSPFHTRMLAEYERLLPGLTLATPEQRAVPGFTPRGDFVDLRWTYPLARHLPDEQ